MENTKKGLVVVIFVALFGIGGAGVIGYNLGRQADISLKSASDHSSMTMNDMTQSLVGLEGDAFDQAFVEMMIVHHQGAVDMAQFIPNKAKHEELKKLGAEIIAAQTKEIAMMKQWLKDWNFERQPAMMNHQMQH